LNQLEFLIVGARMIKLFGMGGKKAEKSPRLGRGFIPTDRVKELSGKGFSEPEMIDVLRKEGFSAEEIDRGLTQALELKVSGIPEPQPDFQTIGQHEPTPQIPQIPEPSLQYPEATEGYGTEELIESIVSERMADVDQRLSEFNAKHAELERNISNLHHQLSITTKGRSQAEQTIIARMDSIKDSIDDMNASMSSLEKAFKDALPALIESVRSLTDLVQRFKKE
jgi:DNA-binding transcriptional MerR regulator